MLEENKRRGAALALCPAVEVRCRRRSAMEPSRPHPEQALSPPVEVRLVGSGEHPCPYLPGRIANNRAFLAGQVSLIASDLVRFLPAAFQAVSKSHRGTRSRASARGAPAD